MPQSLTVADLADLVGATIQGDPSRLIKGCSTLTAATPDELSFLSNPKYSGQLASTNAGCVILAPDVAARLQRPASLPPLTILIAKDPYFAYQQISVKLHGYRSHPTIEGGGISPLASIHPSATIGKNANIHPFAVIAEGVTIGDNANIYSHVSIMANSRIGHDCILYPHVTLYDSCTLGNRNIIHAAAVIGSDGYGYATANGIHNKIPQIGNVVTEDDVEIGAGTVIERAALQTTRIGKGTKIGNLVIVGHNSTIGQHNLLVSQVGIAGSSSTGKYVAMGGQVGLAGHLHVGDMVRIAAQSGVISDLEPNTEYGGSPAMEAKHARRVYMQFFNLPDLAKRVKELEAEVKKLSKPE